MHAAKKFIIASTLLCAPFITNAFDSNPFDREQLLSAGNGDKISQTNITIRDINEMMDRIKKLENKNEALTNQIECLKRDINNIKGKSKLIC
ncbi:MULTISPECIES: hypothetical protein [Dickeya]|uniref:hypothetical protein n=1 Tax=Dickeya TaxID=204037 RepID=UPI00055802D2|nr:MULTISPECIES: hypothetical protein [Dickeya]